MSGIQPLVPRYEGVMPDSKDSRRMPIAPAFKTIFSHRRIIADALRGYAAKPNGPLDPRTVAALDFCTMRKVPTEWVTAEGVEQGRAHAGCRNPFGFYHCLIRTCGRASAHG